MNTRHWSERLSSLERPIAEDIRQGPEEQWLEFVLNRDALVWEMGRKLLRWWEHDLDGLYQKPEAKPILDQFRRVKASWRRVAVEVERRQRLNEPSTLNSVSVSIEKQKLSR